MNRARAAAAAIKAYKIMIKNENTRVDIEKNSVYLLLFSPRYDTIDRLSKNGRIFAASCQ